MHRISKHNTGGFRFNGATVSACRLLLDETRINLVVHISIAAACMMKRSTINMDYEQWPTHTRPAAKKL